MTEFLFLEENQKKHTTQTKTRNIDQLLNEKENSYFKMRRISEFQNLSQDKTKIWLINSYL